MQPTPLSFALDGPTGNLQIMRTGLLLAELTPDDQLELLMAVARAHITRNQHTTVNGTPPQPLRDDTIHPLAALAHKL
jgi:hypothetical protein